MIKAAQDLKRRRILESARKLLIARGYQDVALDDVAREAGVAKGTLFLYYKSKDELFSSAFSDLVDQLGEALDAVAVSGKPGAALIHDAVFAIVSHLDRNRDFMSIGRFPGCGGRSSGKLLEKYAENHERLAKILGKASKDLSLAADDLPFSAALLFGLCRATLVHGALTGRSVPIDVRVAKVVDLYIKGAPRARRRGS
jgi:TetR/AcrR family fatty acid metabolism transcriptional regulator